MIKSIITSYIFDLILWSAGLKLTSIMLSSLYVYSTERDDVNIFLTALPAQLKSLNTTLKPDSSQQQRHIKRS